MKKKLFLLLLLSFFSTASFAQQKLSFSGQLSAIANYSPNNELALFLGTRYLPELSYKTPIDSFKYVDFEVAANLSTSALMHPFDTINADANITPYRIWARHVGKQYEVRIGLQKIDFGSATLLRPLQWFNQIDPRDPLQLTNGVYGILGRYYFLNNANIWLWTLYGNEKTRGFDVVKTNKKIPEIGGRFQHPTTKGEIALSYNYRTANNNNLTPIPQYKKIPEHKIGVDGKWDLLIGFWLEASYSYKTKNIGYLSHQTLLNIGADYTFGIGNGLNVIAENLLISFDKTAFYLKNPSNISALTMAYPIGFFGNLNTVFYYNWTEQKLTAFINYQHQFKNITSYFMAYYNPTTQQSIQQNDLVNYFSGPGIRVMLVYNY